MKTIIKAFHLGVILFSGVIVAVTPTQSPASDAKIRIILVGDSTVTDNAGWGLGFKQFLTDGAECINTAQAWRQPDGGEL